MRFAQYEANRKIDEVSRTLQATQTQIELIKDREPEHHGSPLWYQILVIISILFVVAALIYFGNSFYAVAAELKRGIK